MDSHLEVLTTVGAGAAGALVAVLAVGGPLWLVLPGILAVGAIAVLGGRRRGR